MTSFSEVITWHDAAQHPPSDDMTVLVSITGSSEPVWLGWLDNGVWRDATHGGAIDGTVLSWADVPEGWFPAGAPS